MPDGLVLDKVLQKEYDPYFIAGVKLNDEALTEYRYKIS